MSNQSDSRITGVYAGILSLVEIGLGGILHGMKLPFAGTFLSLNQGVFLTRVVKLNQLRKGSHTLAFRVSNITALLKSLSPAGKKLLPMLAISVQGLLFSMGTLLLGANLPGCFLGAVLSSLWGVFQPLAVLWVVYGFSFGEEQLYKMFSYFSPELLTNLVVVFTALKALAAGGLTWATWNARFDEQDLLNQKLLKWGLKGLPKTSSEKSVSHPVLGAFYDLKSPLFLIPFFLTGVFFYFAEDSQAQFIWKSLRPVAVAYLFFLAIRLFPVDSWVKKHGLGGTALASALEFIEGKSNKDEAGD
jgi:hypothetical protein